MSRSNAAFDYAPANDTTSIDEGFAPTEQPTWAEDKNPTRRLPVFRLEEEARRLDEAAEKASTRCDSDATVTVSAEDNKKLLASLFPGAAAAEQMPSPLGDLWSNEEAPTLDAPAPEELAAMMATPRPVRVTTRPPALKMLVITKPAPPPHTPRASVVPPMALVPPMTLVPAVELVPAMALVPAVEQSGFHAKLAPELVQVVRERRDEERRRSEAPVTIRMPSRDPQTYLVAGIWAMALSLIAVLMFIASSA